MNVSETNTCYCIYNDKKGSYNFKQKRYKFNIKVGRSHCVRKLLLESKVVTEEI